MQNHVCAESAVNTDIADISIYFFNRYTHLKYLLIFDLF